jgi:hypothetical protein
VRYSEERKMKCCGSFFGFIVIGLVTALVVIGALADNNLINGFGFLKNFTLYFIVAFALGLCTVLLNKQQKSLIVTNSNNLYLHE